MRQKRRCAAMALRRLSIHHAATCMRLKAAYPAPIVGLPAHLSSAGTGLPRARRYTVAKRAWSPLSILSVIKVDNSRAGACALRYADCNCWGGTSLLATFSIYVSPMQLPQLKYCLLALLLLQWLPARSQGTATPKDGVYFEKLRPIDKAIFDNDLRAFKSLFRQQYLGKAAIDTATKIGSMHYANDLYFYAAVCAMEHHADSAFYYLHKFIYSKDFDNYDGILGDVGFADLRRDARWKEIAAVATRRLMEAAPPCKDPALRIRLLAIGMADQSNILMHSDTTERKRTIASLVDSVVNILNTYGYPTAAVVGKEAAVIPALILVHAALPVQLRYRDMVYEEGIKGNIPAGYAGVLLDKIQVKQKGTQLYGSQYKITGKEKSIHFYPIEDSAGLLRRREQMGFKQSYAEYRSMVENQFKR